MKKKLSLFLTSVMLLGTLAGCSGTKPATTPAPSPTAAAAASTSPKASDATTAKQTLTVACIAGPINDKLVNDAKAFEEKNPKM